MQDYIVRTASAEDWQKWLNKWKDYYYLEVKQMCSMGHDVSMVIKREKKTL